MKKGDAVILPDPRHLWDRCLGLPDENYSMLNLLKELKSKYGLSWVTFEGNTQLSRYKIIDEKKFNYFYIKFSDLIENF
jgi:hypothetical protein